MPSSPLLEIKDLWKHYGGTPALRGVSAFVHAGQVLALMGHNGAGKSTLVKILAGSARQDSGEIFVDGKVLPTGVHAARMAGIAVIYQDLSLFSKLTVAENIAGQAGERWSYSFRNTKKKAAAILERLEGKSALLGYLDVNIEDLPLAIQQRVAIARALAFDSRILILDEPTAALSMQDADHLLTYVRQLADRGVGILFVSHRISDVQRVADRYLVLRDGAVTLSTTAGELSDNTLARAMFGETQAHGAMQTQHSTKQALAETNKTALIVRDATRHGEFSHISLTLRAGEICVLTGLTGSGRTEFAESLAGLRRLDSGEMRLPGKSVRPAGPRGAMQEGIIYIPEDRLRAGLFPRRAVAENLTGATKHLRSRFGFVRPETAMVQNWIGDFGIRCQSPKALLQTLSGGNQQKVLLARWHMAGPRVLILDEPTAGVDLNAKAEIHERMRQWANTGMALMVISSETDEVLQLADRVLVFHAGKLVLDSMRNQVTREQIIAVMLHGKTQQHAPGSRA